MSKLWYQPEGGIQLTIELEPTNHAITTISVCPTCPPIPVTCTTQPITSWCSSSSTPTAITCTTGGIYSCGGEFYVVKDSECPTVIEYDAPYETGYVCPYNQCWDVNASPKGLKQVSIFEYIDGVEIGCTWEDW